VALTGASKGSQVTITDAAGNAVQGALRADGSSWIPATQLAYSTSYKAAVAGGGTVTFTTMAKPKKLVSTNISMSDGQTYGVGMPVVVRFGSSIPADQRANVEKRLLVTSNPPQLGVWNWLNGGEVHYRPKEYWQPGTKINVRLATGGLLFGGTGYGQKDVSVNVAIGEKFVISNDDATHQMTVTHNDQVVKTIPISLGKKSTPSSSGSMVIMTKAPSELFVSTDPSDPYKETVYWTMRITWSGQYIHAAPWSVGSQGKTNVSHGCVNVSTKAAIWFYDTFIPGDPVTIKNTVGPDLEVWDGYGDFQMPFEEYIAA
jgi:lipoprotein-anchoring transpeptidase ErfK/SrfK